MTKKRENTKPICADCSLAKKDCCHLRGNGAYKFGLTVADITRISKATGKDPSEFADLEKIPAYAYREIGLTFPNMVRMFPGRTRLSLKFDGEDRACHFWEEGKGCTLTRDQRPRTCSLYPVWYHRYGDGDEDYKIDVHALANEITCMAVEEKTPTRTLQVLGQSKPQILHFVKLSDKELDEHSKLTQQEIQAAFGATECSICRGTGEGKSGGTCIKCLGKGTTK